MPARLLTALWLTVLLAGAALAEEVHPFDHAGEEAMHGHPNPLRLVMDVRSNHSDGQHTMEELVRLAEARGVDVLAINEHDRFTIRLGIDPFPQLLGYSMQHPSLYETGVESYFDDLGGLRRNYPQMLFLGGTESTPGYFWSGLPFRDLTLHDAERHIITLGAESPAQIEQLPSFDLTHVRGSFELSLMFWGVAGLLLVLLVVRRRYRAAALLLIPCAAAVAVSLLQKPVDADSEFLQRAADEGLFSAWAHPGTLSGVRPGPMGVQLDTDPYSDRVFEPPTADAFAAVYGDTDSNTQPGDRWDRYLLEFAQGRQAKPIWAVAAGDFHAEGEANEYLGNYPMDVWADAKTTAAVVAALKQGRSVAWGMPKQRNIRMAELYLLPAGGKPMLPGGALASVPTEVKLVARLSERGEAALPDSLQGEWVVDGRVAATVRLLVNGEAVHLPLVLAPGPHVIRLHVPMQAGIRMEANPFLVRVAS